MLYIFFFKQKTAYEVRSSDWSSDVCSSDLDHGQAPARHERGERGVEAGFEVGQFTVDVDADRLERARGRVDFLLPRLAARHHRGDQLGQLRGASDRLFGAARDDGAGDAAAPALLAVLPQLVGDLGFAATPQTTRRPPAA